MRKVTEPATRWLHRKYTQREFMRLLGITEGKVLRIWCLIREVEVSMWSDEGGSRDTYHFTEEEFCGLLGLPDDHRLSAAHVRIGLFPWSKVIEVRMYPKG
jgi:hypothetical protein